jgi:serine protease Do
MPGRDGSRAATSVRAVCVAVLACSALLGCRVRPAGDAPQDQPGAEPARQRPRAQATAPSPEPETRRVLYSGAHGSFVDLIARAREGVVAIHATRPVKSGPAAMFPGSPETTADVALGTGFLIEAQGVYVITNDHIASASTELEVVLHDRTKVPAKVLGRDTALDLALLQINVPRLTPLPLGDSTAIKTGEWIVVLGNPFGDDVTASAGIVSYTGREGAGSLADDRKHGFRTFIQTDARIHRGNSGGPVLDTAGQVIGVAVATSDRMGELSFAIPIERVREVLGPLRDVGTVTRSWLGAKVLPVSPDQADQLGMSAPAGALVTEVVAGSPASRAGVRSGDVILRWDRAEVDHRSLPWRVAQTAVNKPVAVVLWRNRSELPITVVTEAMRQ